MFTKWLSINIIKRSTSKRFITFFASKTSNMKCLIECRTSWTTTCYCFPTFVAIIWNNYELFLLMIFLEKNFFSHQFNKNKGKRWSNVVMNKSHRSHSCLCKKYQTYCWTWNLDGDPLRKRFQPMSQLNKKWRREII